MGCWEVIAFTGCWEVLQIDDTGKYCICKLMTLESMESMFVLQADAAKT